jgi:hypothetical protein
MYSGARTRSRSTVFAAAIAAWLSVACAKPLPALPFATASRGCTQEDIPALVVILTEREWSASDSLPVPHIRIEVAGPARGSSGHIELSPLHRDPAQRTLARAEFRDKGGQAIWLSGFVEIRGAAEGDAAVNGTYRFCTAENSCSTGSFSAPLRSGAARCG